MKQPNFLARMFGYAILERELTNRIADRDATIVSLQTRIADLENRLFMVRGLPVKGAEIPAKGVYIPAYRTGRQRLHDMVAPTVTADLSAEDEAEIARSLTQ